MTARPVTGGHAGSRRRGYLLFLAFIAPNFLFLLVFTYWPVVYNAYLSLTYWNLVAPVKDFVGLENYRDLFTDPGFGDTLVATVVFVVGIVVGGLVLGLAVALLLDQRLRGRGFVRTMTFAPHVLTGSAVGVLWLFIFDPNYGMLRPLFEVFGLDSPQWVRDSDWALPALILVYLWKSTGFVAIIYLAGLQSMPRDLYEAAALDGAGAWASFRRVTLPLLSPVTFFLTVVMVIMTFQAFDVIAVMTGGGPGTATTTLSWYIYDQGFRAYDVGYSSAAAMIMFVVLVAFTALQVRFLERRIHYR